MSLHPQTEYVVPAETASIALLGRIVPEYGNGCPSAMVTSYLAPVGLTTREGCIHKSSVNGAFLAPTWRVIALNPMPKSLELCWLALGSGED